MFRYSIFILLAFLLTSCAGTSVGEVYPRTDGVYRAQMQTTKFGPDYLYLRFYDNGQVVLASIIGTPEAFWLATLRDFRGKDVGHYTVSGGKLSFITRSEYAVDAYSGRVLENRDLDLFSHSYTTGYEDHKVYRFVKIDVNHLPSHVRLRNLKKQPSGDIEPVDPGD